MLVFVVRLLSFMQVYKYLLKHEPPKGSSFFFIIQNSSPSSLIFCVFSKYLFSLFLSFSKKKNEILYQSNIFLTRLLFYIYSLSMWILLNYIYIYSIVAYILLSTTSILASPLRDVSTTSVDLTENPLDMNGDETLYVTVTRVDDLLDDDGSLLAERVMAVRVTFDVFENRVKKKIFIRMNTV